MNTRKLAAGLLLIMICSSRALGVMCPPDEDQIGDSFSIYRSVVRPHFALSANPGLFANGCRMAADASLALVISLARARCAAECGSDYIAGGFGTATGRAMFTFPVCTVGTRVDARCYFRPNGVSAASSVDAPQSATDQHVRFPNYFLGCTDPNLEDQADVPTLDPNPDPTATPTPQPLEPLPGGPCQETTSFTCDDEAGTCDAAIPRQ